MHVKKEQIYLNKDVVNACTDLSQIIVTYLEQHNIEMDDLKKARLSDEIFDDMLNSLDVIILTSYMSGFSDALTFQKLLKEGE